MGDLGQLLYHYLKKPLKYNNTGSSSLLFIRHGSGLLFHASKLQIDPWKMENST